MEDLNPKIKRNDPKTWSNQHWPGTYSTGIVSMYGAGQSKFMWTGRALPGIRTVFETVYKTSKLATSLDGFRVFRPEAKVRPNSHVKWLHIDQNLARLPESGTSFQVSAFKKSAQNINEKH